MKEFSPSKKNRINDKVIISIRMESSKIERIDEVADMIYLSRNELINQCIDYALSNLKISDKKKVNN